VAETPKPYQIRQSNVYALQAALDTLNLPAHLLHFPDNKEATIKGIRQALVDNDVLILSGGVSKGKRDYVPEALEACGVNQHFHRVEQRPGKPFWFGISAQGKTIFALPGNPVSTFMCFYRYVRPWLLRSLGLPAPSSVSAILQEDVRFEPTLTYFLQVKLRNEAGKLLAQPLQGHGSGDFANLIQCDGFLELPPAQDHFKAGENFPLILFREI
jgi:molybdopterin molybdotransferase